MSALSGENQKLRAYIAKLESLATRALREQAETCVLINGHRSKRKKTQAMQAAERARSQAFCEAIAVVNDEPSSTAVLLRLTGGMRFE